MTSKQRHKVIAKQQLQLIPAHDAGVQINLWLRPLKWLPKLHRPDHTGDRGASQRRYQSE